MVLPDPTQVSGPVGARLQIPTEEGPDGQVVHPAVVHTPDMMGGYLYWMAANPYPGSDDSFEDPWIYASFDGINWVVPLGVSNPLDDMPGSPGAYNSDVDLRYYDGTLHLFWRYYDGSGGSPGTEERLYYSSSIDGRTWTPKALIYSSDHTVRRLLSPCFLLEDGAWVMWAVDITPAPNQVVRLQGSATPAGAWGAPVGVSMGPMQDEREAWHLGIIATDDGYVGLLNDRAIGGSSGDLLMVVSPDGYTFTNSGSTVIPREQPGEHTSLYRAVLLPDTDGGIPGWRVWYSAFRTESDSIWHIYRTFINAPYVPPVPETPAQVGRAIVRAVVEWIACDVKTGAKVAYLHGLTGRISRALGQYTSDTLSIPAPLAGPLALGGLLDQAIGPDQLPTRMIVAVINDLPAWAGIIWKVRGGSVGTIELGCATPESYLDRRFIGDMAFNGIDQALLAAALIEAVNVEGIGLAVDTPLTGILRKRDYWDDEDATFYQRLTELMDIQNGLEWTIDLDWKTPRQQAVQLIFRARQRIGSSVPRGPLATASEAVASYELMTDYGKAMGANDVMAYAPGEGIDRPMSRHMRNEAALAAGVPRIEHRWSPTSSPEEAVLDAHATSELLRLDGGTRTLAITSRWNIEPARLGVDLALGDDIQYDLIGHMHPNGLRGIGRMIGYRLDTVGGLFEPVLRI